MTSGSSNFKAHSAGPMRTANPLGRGTDARYQSSGSSSPGGQVMASYGNGGTDRSVVGCLLNLRGGGSREGS